MKLLQSVLSIGLFASLFLWAGCKDDNKPTEPPPSNPPTSLTATQLVTAPSTSDVGDPAWNSITPVRIDISSSALLKSSRSINTSVQTVPTSLNAQAAVAGSVLYLRLNWADATHNIWRDRFIVSGIDTLTQLALFLQDTTASKEDQAMVMFKYPDTTLWDIWQWRALTTDAGRLGEGFTLDGINMLRDAGTVNLSFTNAISDIIPIMMNPGGGLSTDYRLFIQSADSLDRTANWIVSNLLPGWQIDSSLAGATRVTDRNSRFDITAASSYSQSQGYTILLTRNLNTGFTDDLDLSVLTQVTIRLAISNNLDFKLGSGDSNQGFTSEFTLFLQ